MKTTMKKLAACLLALLLVFHMIPAFAATTTSGGLTLANTVLREKLKITSPYSIATVGDGFQVTAPEDYTLTWSSSDPSIAEVDQNGWVTPKADGKVTITASEGSFTDSITLKVIGGGSDESTGEGTEKTIIVINVEKTKIVYDGEEHELRYEVSARGDFDEGKLTFTGTAIKGTDCGTYASSSKWQASDFRYDGDAEIILSGGWLQIKPAEAVIKADNKTKWDCDPDPEFTSTVSGLVGNDTLDLQGLTYSTMTEGGTTFITPDIETGTIVGNYRIRTEAGILTTIAAHEEYLYNIAVINGAYYRLARTTFLTTIEDIKPKLGHVLDSSEYRTEPYDFDNLVITLNGNTYYYNSAKNADKIINEHANYYTVNVKPVNAVKGKISSSNKWLVPDDQKYTDPANMDSYHRDVEIKLVTNTLRVDDYDVYNMLSVNGSINYHRLQKTKIKAQDISQYKNGEELNPGEYTLAPYDFTNVKIEIDGEEYTYSDHVITDEYYDSYYTVEFEKVCRESKVNKNANWYKDENGWLDGAHYDDANDTVGYHANYKATLHQGVKPPRSVTIATDWPEDKVAYPGAEITITATLSGFDGEYTLQWQHSTDPTDPDSWVDEAGANGITYTYILNEETTNYYWRVVAEDVN